jgi:hypothetical protein
MAIAYDTNGGNGVALTNTRTVSLAATGTDRLAVIFLRWNSGTYTALSSLTVDGGTTGLAQVGSVVASSYAGGFQIAAYRVIAPPTSAVDYVATWGGNVEGPAMTIATYTGVDQTTPIVGSTWATAEGESTGPTITVSSATGELVVAGVAATYPGATATADGGQSSRILLNNYDGDESVCGISDEAGAASVTLTWTQDSAKWLVGAVRLAAASGGSIVPHAMAQYINQVIS